MQRLEAIEKMRKDIDRKQAETELEAREISHALGFAFRVIDEFSEEGRNSPAVEKAVQEELQGLLDICAFDLADATKTARNATQEARSQN